MQLFMSHVDKKKSLLTFGANLSFRKRKKSHRGYVGVSVVIYQDPNTQPTALFIR